jgi:hypothetical protein
VSARAARRHDPEPEAPTPESFLEEIRAIINSGTLRGAREVAERGLALYPDHPELKHIHHELRPFRVKVNPDGWILDPLPKRKVSKFPTRSRSKRTRQTRSPIGVEIVK